MAAEQAAARSRRWGARSRRAATRGTTAGPQARRLSRPGERRRRDVGAAGRRRTAAGQPPAAGGGGAADAGVVRAMGAAAHGRGAAPSGRWRWAVGGRREKEEGCGD